MSDSSINSVVDLIGDSQRTPIERLTILNDFPDFSQREFSQLGNLPDFKHALNVFNKIAENPDENIDLRSASIEKGIFSAIGLTTVFYVSATESLPENSTVLQTITKILQNNIGDAETVLSRLLSISEDHHTPRSLRMIAFNTFMSSEECLQALGAYNPVDEITSRFLGLRHLIDIKPCQLT